MVELNRVRHCCRRGAFVCSSCLTAGEQVFDNTASIYALLHYLSWSCCCRIVFGDKFFGTHKIISSDHRKLFCLGLFHFSIKQVISSPDIVFYIIYFTGVDILIHVVVNIECAVFLSVEFLIYFTRWKQACHTQSSKFRGLEFGNNLVRIELLLSQGYIALYVHCSHSMNNWLPVAGL